MTLPLLQSDLQEIAAQLENTADRFAGQTVLITGGRGFVGRYLVETLAFLNKEVLSKPCRVIVLDNLVTAAGRSSTRDEDFTGCEFLAHDVIQPFHWDDQIDLIIHAAGIASPYYYRAHPLETLEVATAGTKNLLEVAKEHRSRLLFMSSSEIYGDPPPEHIPTGENYRGNVACVGPRACYDEGKRLGETLCYLYHDTFGVATSMARPFNLYGPGMSQLDYRVLPNIASALKVGRPFKIYGSGQQTRTYCYITDGVVGLFKTLLDGVPGEPYNIGNPEPELPVTDLVREIESVLGRKVDFNLSDYPDTYPADEPNRRCPDIQKARLQLGYQPRVELRDGLKRFLDWTDEHFTPRP
jgi:UDP-glucuronate decarboxylase